MVALHVALRDGFEDDEVEIRVDDLVVWQQAGVRTRTQISLADEVELDVPAGPRDVEVRALSRGTSGREQVEVDGSTWLSVSLGPDGSVEMSASQEPFRYA